MIGHFHLPLPEISEYVRPADWLQIDHLVTDGEQKAVGLFAVFPSTETTFVNYCTVNATAAYTVDWGDGSAPENFATGVTAEHLFDYDDVTGLTSRGYRQAIITVTPQAGQNLTTINFGKKHSEVVWNRYCNNFLDVRISGTLFTRIRFYEAAICSLMERCYIYQSSTAATSCADMFYICSSLQSLDLSNFNTANVTNMSQMFNSCSSLQSLDVSNFSTANVTNMSFMFSSCSSLQSLDLSNFNTANVTNMSQMFYICSSLQSLDISNFSTANVTNMSFMFNSCSSLQSLDLSNFNTAKVTDISGFAAGSRAIRVIDLSATNLNAVTTNANLLPISGSSLTKCRLPGIPLTFSIAGNAMSAAELNALFGDLKDRTSLTSQSITITGNPGSATCDQSIATAKNWTVIN